MAIYVTMDLPDPWFCLWKWNLFTVIKGFGSKCPFRVATIFANDLSFGLAGGNRFRRAPYLSLPTEIRNMGTF